MSQFTVYASLFILFLVCYTAIILEFRAKVNKTGVALFLGVTSWMVFFLGDSTPITLNILQLSTHLADISQILFFLLGAMTLVELIDSHKGFTTITKCIKTRSKKKVLIAVSFLSFFLSAVLDNLTTTILMVSILKKLVPLRKERFMLSCMVVIAANAGGAWTPIGDVTTTMLWINGQITSFTVMREVFLPSLVCMLVPLCIYITTLSGEYTGRAENECIDAEEPGSRIVLAAGVVALLSVPLIKYITGLPPFMGMLLALSVLWLITDLLHMKHDHRKHLRVTHILTKIDVSSILFFLGILLAVNALESIGILEMVSRLLDTHVRDYTLIGVCIGLFSAILDNVPLVAATMGMYDMAAHPVDSYLWLLIAYTAGTGGSLLVIGSSSGVAVMGLDNISFMEYAKKAFLPAAAGFFAGAVVFAVMHGI